MINILLVILTEGKRSDGDGITQNKRTESKQVAWKLEQLKLTTD